MDDDNRISITVCGDGGCGEHLNPNFHQNEQKVLTDAP